MDYKSLMQQAITLAKEAAVKGDVPVGALVVDDFGNVVSQGANLRQQDNDPTAHAEIVAIRNAAKKMGKYRLDELTMVVTLEPCGMCAGAIAQSRIKRLVFGSYDEKYGAVGSVWDLLRDSRSIYKPEVFGGVSSEECDVIIRNFFLLLRKKSSKAQFSKGLNEPIN
ncbi:MAG: nucleoside deaminase [Alphaproteobacteria bacterium]|nr:nucleoside deaminase [Alphaproteobacteria bacterium]